MQVAYAPFDYISHTAKVVIVGLTPGRRQMGNALLAAKKALAAGATEDDAKREAKVFASFSGPMRSNLVAMLDHIGLHELLGISSSASLWSQNQSFAHFTSALRYPVFLDNRDYSGAPHPVSTPILHRHLTRWFESEMRALPNALFVSLGGAAEEAVTTVAGSIGFNQGQILSGLPHPSGANAERIAYFLGRKARAALSAKVNPSTIEAARDKLLQNVGLMKTVRFA